MKLTSGIPEPLTENSALVSFAYRFHDTDFASVLLGICFRSVLTKDGAVVVVVDFFLQSLLLDGMD